MKKCSKCQTKKQLSQFSPNKSIPDGHSYYCKPCAKSYRSRYLKGTKVRQRKQKNGLLWCNKCESFLPPEDFHNDKNAKTGKSSRCKKCSYSPCIKLSSIDPRECSICHETKQPSEFPKTRYRCKNCDSLVKQQPMYRFRKYKKAAAKAGRAFELDHDTFDLITCHPCHYCGDYDNSKIYSGIDRLDSSIGYTVANCIPCCWPCNRMKSDTNYKDFIKRLLKIVKHLKSIG